MYYYEYQEYFQLQYTTVQCFNLSMLSTKELTAHKNTGFFFHAHLFGFVKIIVTDIIKDAEERKLTPNMH